ncbi:sigma 54-interacting transcriptional regulator [Candidatus Margulisiibacteriota bacterium]
MVSRVRIQQEAPTAWNNRQFAYDKIGTALRNFGIAIELSTQDRMLQTPRLLFNLLSPQTRADSIDRIQRGEISRLVLWEGYVLVGLEYKGKPLVLLISNDINLCQGRQIAFRTPTAHSIARVKSNGRGLSLVSPAEIEGTAPLIEQAMDLSYVAAPAVTPVLITGVAGAGKKRLAGFIHALGPRANDNFVSWSLPPMAQPDQAAPLRPREVFVGLGLSPHELFGRARGGTLLIHGIEQAPRRSQAEIFHILTEQAEARLIATSALSFERLGSAMRGRRFNANLFSLLTASTCIELASLAELRWGASAETQLTRVNLLTKDAVEAYLDEVVSSGKFSVREIKNHFSAEVAAATVNLFQNFGEVARWLGHDRSNLKRLLKTRNMWSAETGITLGEKAELSPAGIRLREMAEVLARAIENGEISMSLTDLANIFLARVVYAAYGRFGTLLAVEEKLGRSRTYLRNMLRDNGLWAENKR